MGWGGRLYNSASTDEKMPGLGLLGRGVSGTSNGIIIVRKDVAERPWRQAGVLMAVFVQP